MKHLRWPHIALIALLAACAPVSTPTSILPTPGLITAKTVQPLPPTATAEPATDVPPTLTPVPIVTVIAETEFGRIVELAGGGGYSTELNEAPLPPERSETERQDAIAAIHTFWGNTDLSLTYDGLRRYTENSGMAVETYKSNSLDWAVDIHNNQVNYFQSTLGDHGIQLTLDSNTTLKDLARQFVLDHNPCFETAESQLVFEEGNKLENYFFRWQVPGPNVLRPWNQPTFLQVGINTSGLVFGYNDSGICYLTNN